MRTLAYAIEYWSKGKMSPVFLGAGYTGYTGALGALVASSAEVARDTAAAAAKL